MSRSRLHIPEDLRAMARAAAKSGWTVTLTGSGHLRWKPPGGAAVVTSSTPGCSRGTRNARARLKRAGLKEGAP